MKKVIFLIGFSIGGKITIGDDYHTKEYVDKMSSGKPLKDDDRRSRLVTLHQLSISQLEKLTKQ